MAPKRRHDAIAKEIPKTYTFGRSQIDGTDVSSLQKNRMIGTARAPGRETVPKPRDNEVVIFRDLLYAGLRFPLHLAVVWSSVRRRRVLLLRRLRLRRRRPHLLLLLGRHNLARDESPYPS
jgi:hypothetical protein